MTTPSTNGLRDMERSSSNKQIIHGTLLQTTITIPTTITITSYFAEVSRMLDGTTHRWCKTADEHEIYVPECEMCIEHSHPFRIRLNEGGVAAVPAFTNFLDAFLIKCESRGITSICWVILHTLLCLPVCQTI
jgi:hypothetical protein